MEPSDTEDPQSIDLPTHKQSLSENVSPAHRLAETKDEKHLLEILATGMAQLKVSVDGGVPTTYAMQENERISLRARQGYNILMEDKCAVALRHNGKSVEIPGRCGRPVNLRIP